MKIRRVDFHPDEFLAAIVGMPPDDVGVYWTVCSRIYSKGKPVPYDVAQIAENFSRKTRPSTVRASLERLVESGKLFVCGPDGDPDGVGFLYQTRCDVVLKSAQTRIELSVRSGKKGGRPRKENNELAKGSGYFSEKLTINHQPSNISSLRSDIPPYVPPKPENGDTDQQPVEPNDTPPTPQPTAPPTAAEPATPLQADLLGNPIPQTQKRKTPPGISTAVAEAFDRFYEAYPLHKAPEAAIRAYARALKEGRATPDDLLAGARRYADAMAGNEPRFIAHPATWLNQGRWKDAPDQPMRASGGSHQPSAISEAFADLRREIQEGAYS